MSQTQAALQKPCPVSNTWGGHQNTHPTPHMKPASMLARDDQIDKLLQLLPQKHQQPREAGSASKAPAAAAPEGPAAPGPDATG